MLVYVVALCAIEAGLFARGHVLLGGVADAIVCVWIVVADALWDTPGGVATDRARVRASRACRALIPVALVRVFALGLPLHRGSAATATAIVACLTIGVCVCLGPAVGVYRPDLLRRAHRRPQAIIAAAGVPLGLVAFLCGAPRLAHAGTSAPVVAYTILCAALGATAEEVLYRGLVQPSMQRVAGRWGILIAATLFAASYAAAAPFPAVLTVAVAGLGFGYGVARTRCLAGAVGGHIAFTVTAGSLCPAVMSGAGAALDTLLGGTVLAVGTAAAAFFVVRNGGRRFRPIHDVLRYAVVPLPREHRETVIAVAYDLARRAAAEYPDMFPEVLPGRAGARRTVRSRERIGALCALGDSRADVLERLRECGPSGMRRPALFSRREIFTLGRPAEAGSELEPDGPVALVEVKYWLVSDDDGAPVGVTGVRPRHGDEPDFYVPFPARPVDPAEVGPTPYRRAFERPFVLESRVPLVAGEQVQAADVAGRLVVALLAARLLWDAWEASAMRPRRLYVPNNR